MHLATKPRINRFIQPIIIFLIFSGIFSLSFIKSHQIKGTFWADETGVINSSITKGRSIEQIFYDAANTSQPPLDHIIREKIYVPIGERLGLANQYPELFHRFAALLWWLLPLGYFVLNFHNYSLKNKTIVIFSLSLLVSSEFLRHYLAEARHYSAIPAVLTTMIIILLSDRVKIGRIKYHFLIISSMFPLLHLISFPYYILFMAYFFYQIRKEINKPLVTSYVLYLIFILAMYYEIKVFSSSWQHPSYKNLFGIRAVTSNIKWTLDWILYGGIVYPIYKVLPQVVKNSSLPIFTLISSFLCIQFIRSLVKRNLKFINLKNLLLINIVLIWPLSILTTMYFSGTFGGERYSIAIMPILLFLISYLIVNLIWRVFISDKVRYIAAGILIMVSLGTLLTEILPVDITNIDTPDNQFVRQNIGVLKDKSSYLILDNGVYSAAFFPLASIYNVPIKINYLQCRDGNFQTSGRNTLNDWLKKHQDDKVYLYSLRSGFMDQKDILWQKDDFVLYRLTHVPEKELCQDPNPVGECYIKCIRGEGVATPSERSIKGVAPHLGVYRN